MASKGGYEFSLPVNVQIPVVDVKNWLHSHSISLTHSLSISLPLALYSSSWFTLLLLLLWCCQIRGRTRATTRAHSLRYPCLMCVWCCLVERGVKNRSWPPLPYSIWINEGLLARNHTRPFSSWWWRGGESLMKSHLSRSIHASTNIHTHSRDDENWFGWRFSLFLYLSLFLFLSFSFDHAWLTLIIIMMISQSWSISFASHLHAACNWFESNDFLLSNLSFRSKRVRSIMIGLLIIIMINWIYIILYHIILSINDGEKNLY